MIRAFLVCVTLLNATAAVAQERKEVAEAPVRGGPRDVSSARGTMGLGLMNTGNGTWHHGGAHSGYRAFLFARPGDRWALVALMSGDSDDADNFAAELFESVRARYQLPMGSLPL